MGSVEGRMLTIKSPVGAGSKVREHVCMYYNVLLLFAESNRFLFITREKQNGKENRTLWTVMNWGSNTIQVL